MSLELLKLKAKARVAAKRKKQSREALIQDILSRIEVQNGKDGTDGKDAPSLEEIMQEVRKALPEPKIVEHKTVQQIKEEISEEKVRELIKQELPEPLTPEIRVIKRELDLDTSEFVTKKELQEVLKRIDQAILASRGGSGNYTNLEERVKTLEELQEYITFDRTDITFDNTSRTWDEE